ncbi:ExeA family protein [Dongia sp.]|uniref:ExeA family protein n=1 Tax=Dongia sp. TaxID=1977262 RepID=UPI0035B31477
MYEDFFGLTEKPFSLLPDPDFLFLSSKHSLALSMLEYSLAGQAGFCAITGEIGSGKTTLIRALLRRMDRDIRLGLITNTHNALSDIAAWALLAFGGNPSGKSGAEIHQELMLLLIEEYGAGRRSVLIVDEAQNLTIEALEELRLLSNINADKDLLLQIILVGQPQLLEKLRRPELCQFAQRISVSYHLTPLSCAETLHYIVHRLRIAGTTAPVFNDMAVGGIQYFAGGVPRLINSICDMAMVYAYADQKQEVDLDHVFRVVGDRMANGVAVFAGLGGPEDPTVIKEITGLIRAAGEARATLPPPAAETEQPEPMPSRMPRRAAFSANDFGGDFEGEFGSLSMQRPQRPSWFRRTFLRATT